MRGTTNQVVPAAQVQPLYRGTLNSYSAISATGLTQNNRTGAQALANTTLNVATPLGILAGSVVRITAPATVGPAVQTNTGIQTGIVGIAEVNAAGQPYESMSSTASGSISYLHGSDSLIAVPVYETYATDGVTPLDYSTAAGLPLYSSANGLLTIAAGLNGGVAGVGATIVGVVVDVPTTQSPILVIQLRI